ncbi:MAG TPA: LytTR family DNA-binding domain-containing protein [Polyangiaceae bacterium]|jgi:DNA-binding LytR/AlgR family response regulator
MSASVAPVETRRLRALVVEDEWPTRNYLVELIEASGLAEVVGAVATVEEAREAIPATAGLAVDVVFVDVQLEGGGKERSGLSLVRSFIAMDRAPMFILATAHDSHALEAFDLGVVDYLLKPFSEERVVQALRRVQARRPAPTSAPPQSSRIVARRRKSLVFLEPSEIWAFEAADRLTFVHTQHGKFDLDLSLTAIEASFGRALMRVHRNWLVNAAHIKELERDGTETKLFVGAGIGEASQGVRVPVSRDRAQALRESLLANATGLRRS